jgi:hypothetical protein
MGQKSAYSGIGIHGSNPCDLVGLEAITTLSNGCYRNPVTSYNVQQQALKLAREEIS